MTSPDSGEDNKNEADFLCERCRQPINLHASLEDLDPSAFDLLTHSKQEPIDDGPSRPLYPPHRDEFYNTVDKSSTNAIKHAVPNPKYAYDSYIVLSNSQVRSAWPITGDGSAKVGTANSGLEARDTLSHRLQASNRLFDIISSHSDIDHPICTDCTETLLDGLEQRLADARRERDAYSELLQRLKKETQVQEQQQSLGDELEAIEVEEKRLLEELKNAEQERKATEKELESLDRESQELDIKEQEFWKEKTAFDAELRDFQNERDALNMKYDHDSALLERLQKCNVYNDSFSIGHDAHFATINGLRMGRLPGQNVEWPEINSAWGQTLLLLHTVAEKLEFIFHNHRLRPLGSTSKIEKTELVANARSSQDSKTVTLDLFNNRTFTYRDFNAAMVAFLDCLRQIGEYAESQDSSVKLPYQINKDKIGDPKNESSFVSIKLSMTQDESWTRACKYVLTKYVCQLSRN